MTGATGFIGSYLLPKLNLEGYQLVRAEQENG